MLRKFFLQFWVVGNISVNILNLDQWFRGDAVLQIFLFLALVTLLYGKAEPFVLFGSAHYEEQFCEIILNLD